MKSGFNYGGARDLGKEGNYLNFLIAGTYIV